MNKREDYISWDEYFMGVAQLSGMRSKDPSTQVGACIVSMDNKILSILNYRGGSLEGTKLYVSLFPCNECAKAIIQAGIRIVVFDSDKYEGTPANRASKKMFDAAGVTYVPYSRTGRQIHIQV